MNIMVSLESSLYDIGDEIIQKGEKIRGLIFIINGHCDLYGIKRMSNDEKLKLKVVRLKTGSWYGDYQILLNTRSSWTLEAACGSKNKSVPANKV